MATPYEPWSPINRGVPLPLAIPWHKRSQVGDDKVAIEYSSVMVRWPHKECKYCVVLSIVNKELSFYIELVSYISD